MDNHKGGGGEEDGDEREQQLVMKEKHSKDLSNYDTYEDNIENNDRIILVVIKEEIRQRSILK